MIRHTIIFSIFFASLSASADIIKPDDFPGASTDRFGTSVSVTGDDIFIGGFYQEAYNNTFSTYIYSKDGSSWSYQKETSPTSSAGDQFGSVLDTSGSIAVVGAYSENVNSQSFAGAVYIYEKVGASWVQTGKIVAPTPSFSGYFGRSVGISGNNMVITNNATNTGADVYFYTKSGSSWTGEKIGNVAYGGVAAISGDTVVAGSQRDGTNYTGAVYVYEKIDGVWNTQKLTASDSAQNNYFGNAVDIDGDKILVGAYYKNSKQGGAYIYTKNGSSWDEYILAPVDYRLSSYFGNSVDISGDVAIVGAFAGRYTGAAYIFTKNGSIWDEVKLTASDGVSNAAFGMDVSVDGDNFAVSADGQVQVYTGTVSSLTKLDNGTSKNIGGISFISQGDWIVGESSSGNSVTAGADVSATVKAAGKAVYIGKNASSNGNSLIIQGKIDAAEVYVGSIDGNNGNMLVFNDSANWASLAEIFLAENNGIIFEKTWSGDLDLFTLLDKTVLNVYDTINGSWVEITPENYSEYLEITTSERGGMSVYMPGIPEPAAYAAVFGLLAMAFAAYKRNKRL